MQLDKVQWGGVVIHYRYRFAHRRTLAITVRPDLSVEVAAPAGTSPELIRSKVRKRGAWIRKSWRFYERFQPLQPPRRFVPGETHRYLGRQYRLRIVPGPTASVALRRGYLEVTTPRYPSYDALGPLVLGWMLERATEFLQQRLRVCQRLVTATGVGLPPLTVRRMKARWGSCTKSGRVILNPDLIRAPKECIDYVIMHELCHLAEHNHSPRFWRLLRKLMPDWEERRERLNRLAET